MTFESRFPVVKELLDDVYIERRSRLALAIQYLSRVKDQSPETFTEGEHLDFNEIIVILSQYASDSVLVTDSSVIDPMAIAFEAYEKVMAQSTEEETKWQDMSEDEQHFWIIIVGTVVDIMRKKYER